jgi:hypothetical protein
MLKAGEKLAQDYILFALRGICMNSKQVTRGAFLATAAAALFMAAPIAANAGAHSGGGDAADAKGQCMGGNSCKGKSSCATANSSCKGQNACKGQGVNEMTKAECDEAGGEFKEA